VSLSVGIALTPQSLSDRLRNSGDIRDHWHTTECYSLRLDLEAVEELVRQLARGQAADTLAPRCFGRMRLASLTRSDQGRAEGAPCSLGEADAGRVCRRWGIEARRPDLTSEASERWKDRVNTSLPTTRGDRALGASTPGALAFSEGPFYAPAWRSGRP
jgi:hypothetical protein